MDAVVSYLLKSGSLLLLFSSVYYLLLRKETFFRSNRFFLISGMLISIVLPLITFTKIIWTAPQPIPATTAEAVTVIVPQLIQKEQPAIDWWLVISLFYLAGALFFIGQFILDYYLIRKVLSGRPIRREGKFRIIETTEDLSPFSYFNYIVYNPLHYSEAELENILEHEKTHCREYHSADVLFTRLCCIAFWFNPIVWLYKSQITQNLEFIADAEANRRISDRKNYQITLLKVTARENCLAFTNPFYQSLIKKRIIMLNKKQSKKINLLKYSVVFPVLFLFMLQFQVTVIAQTKEVIVPSNANLSKIEMQVDASSKEKELNEMVDFFKTEFGATLQFSGYETNSKGEVTGLNVSLKNREGIVKRYNASDKKTIKPFTIYINISPNGIEDFGFRIIRKGEKYVGATSEKQWATVDSILAGNSRKVSATATHKTSSKNDSQNNASFPKLLIINGKEYDSDMLKDYVITASEYILQLSPEDAVKKYGDKGKNGVLIFEGVSTMVKKEPIASTSTPVKIITLDNGDQAVFIDKAKMKIPDHPTIVFDNTAPELIINDVKYQNPKETIAGMDLDKIKSIQLIETTDPDTKQKTYAKVVIQLK